MEANYDLLLAIYKDEVFATKYETFGYSTIDELKSAVAVLGQLGFVKSNIETRVHQITFGIPGESLDVRITQRGISALHKKGKI